MNRKKLTALLLCLIVWFSLGISVLGGSYEADEILESYLGELDLQELEDSMEAMLPEEAASFRETVWKLFHGELPFRIDEVQKIAADTLFAELVIQKKLVIKLLILAVAAAVFTNFVQVFQKNQISETAFYIIYLILFILLMHAFQELQGTAKETMGQILHFMKLLLPVYLIVASLAAGSVTAVGFYELTLLFITLVQSVMVHVVLPGIGFYVLFLLLNHLGREEYLSKLADFLKTLLTWLMRTLLAMIVGIETVQALLLPAIDSLKNSMLRRMTGAVPILGNTFSAVTETLLGTAVLLKNAVGAAGLVLLGLIILIPLLRLAVCTLLYRALGAAIQPVSDGRITECVSGIGEGIGMLLRAVAITGVMFFTTLAMVTASVHG